MSPNKLLLGVERVMNAGDRIVHLDLSNGAVCAINDEATLRELERACRRALDARQEHGSHERQ